MSCESVMMRMRNRARNGAVGKIRLETGAHHPRVYPNSARRVNTHACFANHRPVRLRSACIQARECR